MEEEKVNGSVHGTYSEIVNSLPTAGEVASAFQKSLPGPSTFSPRRWTIKNAYDWPPPDSNRDTAWLDGLRGIAAFFVMTYHFTLDWWFALYVEAPYGAVETLSKEVHWFDFWRLPILRIPFTSGHTQVSVFFVLSGFVLSWSSLGSIRAGRADKLANTLGSATFRRWIRLYLPVFAVTFFEFCELRTGWRGITNRTRLDSTWEQFKEWFASCDSYANPFTLDRNNWNSLHDFDWTVWTIPYEFAGSLCVFLILISCGRIASYRKRSVVIGFMAMYACYEAKWSYHLFISGVWIADHVKECGGFEGISKSSNSTTRLRWFIVFIVGLLLAGTPEPSAAYSRPGYAWLDNFVPARWEPVEGGGRFWWNWAGILIILSACHLPGLWRIFSSPVCRYLGRISFMMYITHRIVLNGIGNHIKTFVFAAFGRAPFIDQPRTGGLMHPLITFLLFSTLWAIHLPIVIFVANWAEILIDAPSTRLAKRIDDYFVGKKETIPNGVLPTAQPQRPVE